MDIEKRKRYAAEYDRNHRQRLYIALNLVHDADILEWLDHQSNKQGEIKRLIREEIRKDEQTR